MGDWELEVDGIRVMKEDAQDARLILRVEVSLRVRGELFVVMLGEMRV